MRPFILRTVTVGLREQVVLTRSVEPIIAWSWWCRWILRRRCHPKACAAALRHLRNELGEPRAVPTDPAPPQAFAVELSVALEHGTPDEWRAVRWRDAMYALEFRGWIHETKEKRGSRPVWGVSSTEPRGPGSAPDDPRYRQVA